MGSDSEDTKVVKTDGRVDTRRETPVHLATSVVIPCLNEQDSIALCVREALEAMSTHGIEGEVVVVDNGSTDDSMRLATQAGARIVNESRRGYGSALRTGITAARGDVVVMADGDNTYDLSRIPDLIEPIEEGRADLVLGSRLDSATRQTMPILHRYVGTPLLTFLTASVRAPRRHRQSVWFPSLPARCLPFAHPSV